ncbi:hypothetical protein V1478_001986 [Vespula squamosa]|uniref:Uncharacterized protein n=1 Tax=Vespula squamosa TaxID=30214 RepID=A0ABD2BYQ0_VESSQ
MKIEIVIDHTLKYLLNQRDEQTKPADSQGRSGWHHLLQWEVVVYASEAFYHMVATSIEINLLPST